MPTLAQANPIDKLPVAELEQSLQAFLEPVTNRLPDVRLGAVAELLLRGIVTSQSPIVTQIARGAGHLDETIWPTCQRAYRFLSNERFSYRTLRKGMYRLGQASVAAQALPYLVIAVDPVHFETCGLHARFGRREPGDQEHAAQLERREAPDAWLSRDHRDGRQWAATGHYVCQLA